MGVMAIPSIPIRFLPVNGKQTACISKNALVAGIGMPNGNGKKKVATGRRKRIIQGVNQSVAGDDIRLPSGKSFLTVETAKKVLLSIQAICSVVMPVRKIKRRFSRSKKKRLYKLNRRARRPLHVKHKACQWHDFLSNPANLLPPASHAVPRVLASPDPAPTATEEPGVLLRGTDSSHPLKGIRP